MANINNKLKDIHTNTFYVNPTYYDPETEQVTKDADNMGVSFSEPSYNDGIEVPDKLVTVNGATNYHILDAVNLYWDDVKIPWAQKITKWKDATALSSDPTYEYNKPDVAEGKYSWANDGIIRESEDIADILNYLIYRTVSIDNMLDQMNSVGLQTPALRLVNNRTDWYTGNDNIIPDNFDGDSTTQFYDTISDNRFTVKPAGLKVYLYPYLMSKYWHGPDSEEAPINISENVPLLDSTGNIKPGIVLSDTGWDVQREVMWNGQGKIKEGEDNFDIFQIETISTSTDIRFNSSKRGVLDSFVSKNLELSQTRIDGDVNETTIETCYLYKLPVVAYKCMNTEKYPYTALDLLSVLIKGHYKGLNGSNNDNYRSIKHTTFTPQIDPTYTNVTFSIEIARTPADVDVPNPEGYKGDSKVFNVIVYKGDNTLYDLKLEDKSHTYKNISEEIVKQTFVNSRGNNVDVNGYLTTLPITPSETDYENEDTLHLFKSKIKFECEFGPDYDALPENNGNPDNLLKKSHVYPYFIVKTDSEINPNDVINSINVEAYKTIYSPAFESSTTEDVYVLYDNKKYGKITYEKTTIDVEGETEYKWEYFYWTPTLENVGQLTNNTLRVKLYAFMYYKIDDVTTNRLLNPLYAELPITLKKIESNRFTSIHGKELNSGNYVDDCITFDEIENYSTIDENGNLVINLCDICETEKGSTDFSCEVVGYALEDYTDRIIENENLKKTQLGVSYTYNDGTVFPIKTEDNFIVIEKDAEGQYRKSIPQSQFWSYDGTTSIEIDEINLDEGDNKLIDVVEGIDSETNEKFVNLVIKNSTAMYPNANGLLMNEGDLRTFVDADKDYFYIVLKIKCARNFNNYVAQSELDDGSIYDECECYYALKVKRKTLSFSVDEQHHEGYVRKNIYLHNLLNNDDLSILEKHSGERKWGINPNNISECELSGGDTVKLVNNIILDNIHFFNVGDEWSWRHLFKEIETSGGSVSNYLEEYEEIEIGGETKTIKYTTNFGLFNKQLLYLEQKYGDRGYGESTLTDYGEDIQIFGEEMTISQGPILYIERLKTVANGQTVYYTEDTVNLDFELCVGNDAKYNFVTKQISDFQISKQDSDVIPISKNNTHGEIINDEYYSFVETPDNMVELQTIVENEQQKCNACFCFVSTLLGSYYLGTGENNEIISRGNINNVPSHKPIIMNGDIIVGANETTENSLKYLKNKQIVSTSITLNGGSLYSAITEWNFTTGYVTIKFNASELQPSIEQNVFRIVFELCSDIYKKNILKLSFKKTMEQNSYAAASAPYLGNYDDETSWDSGSSDSF